MTITRIVIHCSDTPNGRETSAADIHRWHSDPKPKGNGWDGIGYHHVITIHGDVQAGRPHYWQGAHAAPFNQDSLGICLIGRDQFTDAQWRSLEGLVLALTEQYQGAEVLGHRDLNNHKTCPNFDVKAWWEGVQARGID